MRLLNKLAGWTNIATLRGPDLLAHDAIVKMVDLVVGRSDLKPHQFRTYRNLAQREKGCLRAEYMVCHGDKALRFLVDFKIEKERDLAYPQGGVVVWVENPKSTQALPVYIDTSASCNWTALRISEQSISVVKEFREKAGL